MTEQPRTVLRNAFNQETFIFTGRTDDAEVARFDVVLGKGGSAAGTPSSMSIRLPKSALSSLQSGSRLSSKAESRSSLRASPLWCRAVSRITS